MNVRRIVALLGACALGAVAGHWHGRSGFDTTAASRVSNLCSEVATTHAYSPALLDEIERIEPDAARDEAQLVAPVTAFERSLQLGDPQARLDALRSSFARLVRVDWAQALNQASRISEDERDAIVGPALGDWAIREPLEAWKALDRADLAREHRVVLLTALAEQEPQAALSWLRDATRDDEDPSGAIELYRAVMPALLRDDLSAAESLIADLGRDAPLDLIQRVAVEHTRRNPLDGLDWAKSVAARSEYEQAQTLQAVSASVVAADPDAAAALLDRSADAQIRTHLMREIAGYKAQRSVRDAWGWLQAYRGDDAYRESARAMLSAWSHAKPAEVASVVIEIDDVEFQRGAAEQLSNVWQERDPRALREWVATLPQGKLRDALRPRVRED